MLRHLVQATALILLPLTLACAQASHVPTKSEIYNSWKDRCYELSKLYREKLKIVPYHMIANRDADKCSSTDPTYQWEADAQNMHILVANLFYHYDFDVQAKALELLEHYHCEADHDCDELADLLDAHIKSSLPQQSPRWKSELHPHVRDFWRYLKTKQ